MQNVNEEAKQKHPLMSHVAWTFGPGQQGQFIAAGVCKGCRAQLTGSYAKSRDRSSDPVKQVALHRGKAVASLIKKFDTHVCVLVSSPAAEA